MDSDSWRLTLVAPAEPKAVSFEDLGGIDGILKDIQELVQWPLMHPEVPQISILASRKNKDSFEDAPLE